MPLALAAVVVLTSITLTGMQRTKRVNVAIVSLTLLSLGVFVVVGLPHAMEKGAENLRPFFGSDDGKLGALLQATALMFVAYTGYGRVATLGEEVREPRRTIPLAVIATLAVSMVLYLVVGAVTAMAGVLLNLIIGLSRVLLAMGRQGDMPGATARLGRAHSTPYVAVVVIGLVIAGLVLLGNVRLTWTFSAFTVLIYYGITNFCALRLPPAQRLYPRWISVLGLVACFSLAFFVERDIWLVGLGLVTAGAVWHKVATKIGGRN